MLPPVPIATGDPMALTYAQTLPASLSCDSKQRDVEHPIEPRQMMTRGASLGGGGGGEGGREGGREGRAADTTVVSSKLVP